MVTESLSPPRAGHPCTDLGLTLPFAGRPAGARALNPCERFLMTTTDTAAPPPAPAPVTIEGVMEGKAAELRSEIEKDKRVLALFAEQLAQHGAELSVVEAFLADKAA